ncbi:hypothetical protein [Oceaniglobus roseus]|uniref:hypothetical protein n=1 Tax=Oceaniglobus roseus TaxID=1737570 RepID=UPI001562751F|nr:hypothetical protein [Kandeliimicrobium roseum]
MRAVSSFAMLEKLGRVRLSRHFHMREFLYSEIANFHGIPNFPEDPEMAIAAGTRLCTDLLDPLVDTFGPITLRGSYRNAAVNGFGNAKGMNCAMNASAAAHHRWDARDGAGHAGAMACVSVPWFAAQYEAGRDWRDLAWWIHDHLPPCALWFFPKRAAFNIGWHAAGARTISSYIAPKGKLLAAGAVPGETAGERQARHADFPPFRGIAWPELPERWR